MIKNCLYCKEEVKPIQGFFEQTGKEDYKKMREQFKEEFGYELQESDNYNCLNCGQVYDKKGEPLPFKLGWLQ